MNEYMPLAFVFHICLLCRMDTYFTLRHLTLITSLHTLTKIIPLLKVIFIHIMSMFHKVLTVTFINGINNKFINCFIFSKT